LVERYYAGAEQLGVTERVLPDGGMERVTLLRTDLKYPLVRVVDRLGPIGARGQRPVRQSLAMAAGHLLVDPAANSDTAAVRARLESMGWRVRAALPQSGQLLAELPTAAVTTVSDDRFPELRSELTAELGNSAAVEPDYLYYPGGPADDPFFANGSLWGLRNEGQSGGTAGADISAVEAWDIRNDASGVVVAVIDTGVRMTHEDIAPNLWTNSGEIPGNGIDDDGNGVVDDVHGFDAIDGGGDPSDDRLRSRERPQRPARGIFQFRGDIGRSGSAGGLDPVHLQRRGRELRDAQRHLHGEPAGSRCAGAPACRISGRRFGYAEGEVARHRGPAGGFRGLDGQRRTFERGGSLAEQGGAASGRAALRHRWS
jgi:hypothetical protein